MEAVDYCTSFPDGWWAHCCEGHDRGYDNQIGQATADTALRSCVEASRPAWAEQFPQMAEGLSVVIALIMFAGVTLFGRRFYKRAGKKAAP